MSRERQYMILASDGSVCGSAWADSVQPRMEREEGFWLLRKGEIVASAWFGYVDTKTQERFMTPTPIQSANAEEPVTVGIADGSAKA